MYLFVFNAEQPQIAIAKNTAKTFLYILSNFLSYFSWGTWCATALLTGPTEQSKLVVKFAQQTTSLRRVVGSAYSKLLGAITEHLADHSLQVPPRLRTTHEDYPPAQFHLEHALYLIPAANTDQENSYHFLDILLIVS